MRKRLTRLACSGVAFLIGLLILPGTAFSYDLNAQFSVGGVLAGAYQYLNADAGPDTRDGGELAAPLQPELSFHPTARDEFFLKLGFAAGNGLNPKSPFTLSPWAADLEGDVKDINGRDRDYLLTAGYEHELRIGENHALELSGGLIDATDYLDENAYANDEYTQFMNQALVNAPNGFLPSYDIGGALEWDFGPLRLRGVIMDVGQNDAGNNYQFYGIQLGYTLDTPFGEGNYRLLYHGTSSDFPDPDDRSNERLSALVASFDQQFGEIIGAWLRFCIQEDAAAIDHKALYSGGIDISGSLWGHDQDNIGVGIAYLSGGNQDRDNACVAEAYVRCVLNEFFAATLDFQYLKEDLRDAENPEGIIAGLRLTAEF
ncbi:MAG: carbohydrate porin [Desulfobacterales bacterium]|nr:MAG: carbohydrate porin [Desulfobacterales bacterium]